MEQRIFSFGIKEQLIVMLQNVNDVEQKSAPTLQQRYIIYEWPQREINKNKQKEIIFIYAEYKLVCLIFKTLFV